MQHVTYCRICAGTCGLVVDVEENRVVRAIGDVDNPLTRGFSCPKGRHIGDFVSAPDRYRTSMKRVGDVQEPIEVGAAIEEISVRLRDIVEEHGPDSVAFFTGTQAAFATLTGPFAGAWWRTVGSHKSFSSMTIDQSAMWVVDGRMGRWAAGRQDFDTADVWMLVGTNPIVSLQGGDFTGFPTHDPVRRLHDAKKRGLQLIVVDPRRTEVAAQADIHLQLRPGTDVALFAALLHVLVRDGLQDDAFVARWVDGFDDLRAAVASWTPQRAAERCDVPVADIEAAARMFGAASRGMALSGTGPDMGPDANLAEHLIRSLNVVCGRYPQAGDAVAGQAVLGSAKSPPGMAIGPDRTWERGYRSRFGFGLLQRELPTGSLPAEILEPGPDQVRALFVSGANPASAIPDQALAIRALSSLELLVTVDPFPSQTAKLAHYVIAPVMHLERPDITRSYEQQFEEPYAMYTPAIVDAPPDAIDDWEFWLRLAWAGGHSVSFAGRDYPPGSPVPTTEEVLASMATRGRASFDEVKTHPHGKVYADLAPPVVGPPIDGADGRFALLASDVADELAAALAGAPVDDGERPFRLVVRRTKETLNSLGTRVPGLPRHPYNPCFANPDDLEALGCPSGTLVTISSAHGDVEAVVQADATLRRGVLSMTHGFGGLPGDDDPLLHGSSTSRLMSLSAGAQSISAMPHMSAIPVSLVRADVALPV
jgi:anaerobic selenocysteine-containing dehydrogenase